MRSLFGLAGASLETSGGADRGAGVRDGLDAGRVELAAASASSQPEAPEALGLSPGRIARRSIRPWPLRLGAKDESRSARSPSDVSTPKNGSPADQNAPVMATRREEAQQGSAPTFPDTPLATIVTRGVRRTLCRGHSLGTANRRAGPRRVSREGFHCRGRRSRGRRYTGTPCTATSAPLSPSKRWSWSAADHVVTVPARRAAVSKVDHGPVVVPLHGPL
jgi:hypothetical protein